MVAALVAVPAFASRTNAKDNSAQADRLFSGREIPHLIIRIPDEEMDILRDQRRQNGRVPMRTNVLVTVRDGDSFYTNVTLHLKGSASFRGIDSKPALTLTFDKHEEKQRFRGLQKISLNNSMHDPTYLCEKLGREIYTAAGIPVPRVAHATVELNGRDLGVFVLAEGWNKQFLKRHFRDPDGNFYERKGIDVTTPLELKSGDHPEEHRALKALADAVQETDPQERWRKLGKTLDVDQFITGMAVEIMIGHWDGYCRNRNNFRVFHDRTQDRIVFLPHGMDQLFGMRPVRNDMPVAGSMKGLVAIAVMESPEGCRRYIKRMDELLEKYFDVAAMTNRVVETSERLRPLLESDPGMLETNQNSVARLLEQIPQRYEAMREQLTALQTPLPIGQKETVAPERWESKRDLGNPTLAKDGRNALQITGTGTGTASCIGSWRAVFFLEPGRYRLEGDVSVEHFKRGNTLPEGIATLRSSESEDGPTALLPQTRTNLTHHFTVSATRYVELICEYRGSSGKALFDGESITLRRLDGFSTPASEKQKAVKRPE